VRLVAKWLGDTETTLLNVYAQMFPDEEGVIRDFFDSKF
jgi:hypothetical protein